MNVNMHTITGSHWQILGENAEVTSDNVPSDSSFAALVIWVPKRDELESIEVHSLSLFIYIYC
jgi:hypothetical protein